MYPKNFMIMLLVKKFKVPKHDETCLNSENAKFLEYYDCYREDSIKGCNFLQMNHS